MDKRRPLTSLLVKPAGPDCNMACSYCFYHEKKNLFSDEKVHRMHEEILEEMIRQAMEQSSGQISFAWQGGEPTLMGLSFFRKAVSLQQLYGGNQQIGNGLQTNGIFINKEWAEFLNQYNFLVGLSLDGPEHVHDKYRHIQSGLGSWSRVVDRAKLLLDKQVAVNAITVVNDYSVLYPEEIYDFHKALGLNYMQFIPCVETDSENPKKAAPFSVSAKKYGLFLCKLFDLWISDFRNGAPTTSVRFFDSIFYSYVNMQPPECTLLKECGDYVVVEHNGDVYACDFFVEPQWKLGNIVKRHLLTLLNSKRQRKFGRQKANLHISCRDCEWLKHCRGGCVKDRIRDPRDNNLNHFCRAFTMFFTHADAQLRQLAEEWKHQQGLMGNREKVTSVGA
jgi:uncharacterized protein